MTASWPYRCIIALVSAALFVACVPSAAVARGNNIALCHAGIVDLLSFPEHIKNLRMTRYSKADIDGLIALQHRRV